MYKKIDMVAQAGKWWTITKMQRETAVKYIGINAREIIEKLNEEDEDDGNVANVLMLLSTAVAVANDGEDITPCEEIIQQVNNVLDWFGFQSLSEPLFEELPPLDSNQLVSISSKLDDLRENFEPKYGDVVIGLVLCAVMVQSQQICQSAYDLATIFCDDQFDIVPCYEDFLLDF